MNKASVQRMKYSLKSLKKKTSRLKDCLLKINKMIDELTSKFENAVNEKERMNAIAEDRYFELK